MKPQTIKRTMLVIDDDRVFCEAVKDYLSSETLEVLLAHTASDGLTLASLRKVDVVILDQQLPDAAGHTICADILKNNEQAKIIFSTAFPSFENAVNAIRAGAHDYLSKPYDLEELALAVKQALRTLALEQIEEVQVYQRSREKEGTVIVEGEGMADTMHLVGIASDSDSPVLITGETGTGKSLLAKAIHFRGKRSGAPFVSINCASLPEALIEAELFGYERGSFTGAVSAKKGLFEMAEGGTLFLDEIGEMPIHLQSKLLSALEDRMIRRIGGVATKPVNVRIIAATSLALEGTLGTSFRKDLYYRLSVIRIHIPSLRDRSKDIPALSRYLLGMITKRDVTIPDDDLSLLMKYDWPGNIRELKNILERTVFTQKGPVLQPSLLLERPAHAEAGCSYPAAAGTTIKTLDDCEKEIIGSALLHLKGNLMQTAKALGISLSTLKRKTREYHIR